MPKYSLTSQKPASLTWLKNSEPAPTASASSAARTGSRSAASGATIPAAVMVATVAEPVASRMNTATNQPTTNTEMDRFRVASAITCATPVSTRVCLNPPPAPTMSRIAAMGR